MGACDAACTTSAATKRNLNTIRFRGCLGVRHTLRHQPPPVSRSWSKTAVHKLGGSVRMLRPRTRPYPAVPTLTRNGRKACYILFVRRLWCDVVRSRSTKREAVSHGAASRSCWVDTSSQCIESNESNQRIRSARTAVSTCQTVAENAMPGYQPQLMQQRAERRDEEAGRHT